MAHEKDGILTEGVTKATVNEYLGKVVALEGKGATGVGRVEGRARGVDSRELESRGYEGSKEDV